MYEGYSHLQDEEAVKILTDVNQEHFDKGVKLGISKGKDVEKIIVVCRATERGISPKDISYIVDLPISEVERIIEINKVSKRKA